MQDAVLEGASGGSTAMAPRLSKTVYDGIVALIARGDFEVHARLPSEVALSDMFMASRPVVREALSRLREDGLIVSRKGSGSYVRRRPDPSVIELAPIGSIGDVQRCFEFRSGLEPATASLAALRWEGEDFDRIVACMAALERCVTEGILGTEEDCHLHEAIAEATHNSYHRTIQLQLRPHILAGMNITRNLSLRRPSIHARLVQDEHEDILDAIRRRDADLAGKAMQKHILSARSRMFDGVDR